MTKDSEESISKGCPRKDLNWRKENMALNITTQDYDTIIDIIQRDCSFLEKCNIIDYSLLVGIHDKEKAKSSSKSQGL